LSYRGISKTQASARLQQSCLVEVCKYITVFFKSKPKISKFGCFQRENALLCMLFLFLPIFL